MLLGSYESYLIGWLLHNVGIVSLYMYIIVYAHHKRVRAQNGLNLDFGHFYLVHAQSTKLIELGT